MKPIETAYSGYKFRSRLEARWAVFYDVLHIPYQYEREGYDLDDMWYLPDFWLPEQDCWVEIKAQAPTEDEKEKAQRLAWYTGKSVYIFEGDIWETPARSFSPITLFAKAATHSKWESLSFPYDLRILLFKAYLLSIVISVEPESGMLFLDLKQERRPFGSIEKVMRFIRLQNRELPQLLEEIEQRIPEWLPCIVATTPTDETVFILDVQGGTEFWGYTWMVCKQCKRASIYNRYSGLARCSCSKNSVEDDERLLFAAYTLARQARFDGKDTFHLEQTLSSVTMPVAKHPLRLVVQTIPQHGGELPRQHITEIEWLEQIFRCTIRKVDKPIDPKK